MPWRVSSFHFYIFLGVEGETKIGIIVLQPELQVFIVCLSMYLQRCEYYTMRIYLYHRMEFISITFTD